MCPDQRERGTRVVVVGNSNSSIYSSQYVGTATRIITTLTEAMGVTTLQTPMTYVTQTLQDMGAVSQEVHEKTYWQSFNTKAYGGKRKKK
jgi:hypothetical protein